MFHHGNYPEEYYDEETIVTTVIRHPTNDPNVSIVRRPESRIMDTRLRHLEGHKRTKPQMTNRHLNNVIVMPRSFSNQMTAYSWTAVTLISGNPGTYRHLQGRAVVAGTDSDRTPIWVGRAHHAGELVPCKVLSKHGLAYIPYNGQEIAKFGIEVLCAEASKVQWLPSSNGHIVPGAVNAGRTNTGESLFIGRAHYNGSLTPGKIHPSHRCLYISHGGNEISIKAYEILVID